MISMALTDKAWEQAVKVVRVAESSVEVLVAREFIVLEIWLMWRLYALARAAGMRQRLGRSLAHLISVVASEST
ncbi:MAG: hypothetical protein ACR2KG_04325 [Nocardioidaceae bacterium]